MTPDYHRENVRLYCGDSNAILPHVGTVDAVVTDPPYGLSFMGKAWDYDVPETALWALALAALRPGGHLLAFAGTRTQHRMAVRIEDAGFEIRDMLAWVYGSGFPKSLDVSKAIDKEAGVEREKVRVAPRPQTSGTMSGSSDTRPWIEKSRIVGFHEVAGPIPATPAARQWSGWGTALKPALEPITLARKPLDGTVAENVLDHGTGALNVDGCRVGMMTEAEISRSGKSTKSEGWGMRPKSWKDEGRTPMGRWPANLIHDGSDEVVAVFPETSSGVLAPHHNQGPKYRIVYAGGLNLHCSKTFGGDSGSASRFFYECKATREDRNEGCEAFFWHMPRKAKQWNRITEQEFRRLEAENVILRQQHKEEHRIAQGNIHATVKPTTLMRYLCRLVTPPGGIVLDPFTGSGSTGKAAILEGFGFVGIELDRTHFDIAVARIEHAFRLRDEARKVANEAARQGELFA